MPPCFSRHLHRPSFLCGDWNFYQTLDVKKVLPGRLLIDVLRHSHGNYSCDVASPECWFVRVGAHITYVDVTRPRFRGRPPPPPGESVGDARSGVTPQTGGASQWRVPPDPMRSPASRIALVVASSPQRQTIGLSPAATDLQCSLDLGVT